MMKSKTTERILSETPQETKDKVRETTSREIDLLRLGFEKNQHQETYIAFKYDRHWHVDFWEVEELDGYEWSVLIEDLSSRLTRAKNQWYNDLKTHPAYELRAKEDKKQILDALNKYKSWYKQETQCKMGRGNPNLIRETELRAKIEILKELYDSKRNI
jgi:hypothetical protein